MTTTKDELAEARELVQDALAELRGALDGLRDRERQLIGRETALRRKVAAGEPGASDALAELRRTLAVVQQSASTVRPDVHRLETMSKEAAA